MSTVSQNPEPIYTATRRIFTNQPGRILMGFPSDEDRDQFLSTLTPHRYLREILTPLENDDQIEFHTKEGELQAVFISDGELSVFKKYAELIRFWLNQTLNWLATKKISLPPSRLREVLENRLKPEAETNEAPSDNALKAAPNPENIHTLFEGRTLKEAVVQRLLGKLMETEPLRRFRDILKTVKAQASSDDLQQDFNIIETYLSNPIESAHDTQGESLIHSLQNLLLSESLPPENELRSFLMDLNQETLLVFTKGA